MASKLDMLERELRSQSELLSQTLTYVKKAVSRMDLRDEHIDDLEKSMQMSSQSSISCSISVLDSKLNQLLEVSQQKDSSEAIDLMPLTRKLDNLAVRVTQEVSDISKVVTSSLNTVEQMINGTSVTTQLPLLDARFAAVETKGDTTLRGLAEIRAVLASLNASSRMDSLLPAPMTLCHCETQTDFVTSSDFVGQTSVTHGVPSLTVDESHVCATQQGLVLTSLESKVEEVQRMVSSLSASLGLYDVNCSTVPRFSKPCAPYPPPNEPTSDGGVWMVIGENRYWAKNLQALKLLRKKINKRIEKQSRRRERRREARAKKRSKSMQSPAVSQSPHQRAISSQ